jgi:hypothetical protein
MGEDGYAIVVDPWGEPHALSSQQNSQAPDEKIWIA